MKVGLADIIGGQVLTGGSTAAGEGQSSAFAGFLQSALNNTPAGQVAPGMAAPVRGVPVALSINQQSFAQTDTPDPQSASTGKPKTATAEDSLPETMIPGLSPAPLVLAQQPTSTDVLPSFVAAPGAVSGPTDIETGSVTTPIAEQAKNSPIIESAPATGETLQKLPANMVGTRESSAPLMDANLSAADPSATPTRSGQDVGQSLTSGQAPMTPVEQIPNTGDATLQPGSGVAVLETSAKNGELAGNANARSGEAQTQAQSQAPLATTQGQTQPQGQAAVTNTPQSAVLPFVPPELSSAAVPAKPAEGKSIAAVSLSGQSGTGKSANNADRAQTSGGQTGTSPNSAQAIPAPSAQASAARPAVAPPTQLASAEMSLDAGTPDLMPDTLADLEGETAALPQRMDARTIEAAAQQSLRNASAPQLASMVSRMGEQFLERFNGKSSSFEIRLDPPELGKVDVRVEVGKDGKIMTVLAARDPAVVEALLRGARTLENVLTQAGLNLSDSGVQVQLDQRHASGSGREHRGDEFADHIPGREPETGDELAEASIEPPHTTVFESWSRQRLNLTA